MTDEWAPPPPRKSKPRWLRRLLWTGGTGLAFLVMLYFFLTSAFFFKTFILPRVGSAINASVTVGSASISPFSSITLKDLKLTTGDDSEPLVTAKEVRARYRLLDIIGGNINVDEIALDSSVVEIVQNADGTSNLDPLLKSSSKEQEAAVSEEASQPLRIDLRKLSLRNATVRRVKLRSNGDRELVELANINIDLENLRNGGDANLTLSSGINFEQLSTGAPANTVTNLLQSELNGSFEIGLSDELKPQTVKGGLSLNVTRASAAFQGLAGFSATLDCALTPTNLDDLLLTFTQEGKPLGRVSLKGPVDVNKQEGQLKLEFSGIDRQALNLIGASAGVDFGTTTLSSIHEIKLAQGGQIITARGSFNLNQLSVSRNNVKPIDLQLDYETTLNRAENSAVVKSLTINGTQDTVLLIQGALARPATLSFGGVSNFVSDAAFSLTATNCNLADWSSIVGDYGGRLSLVLNLLCRDAGKAVTIDLTSQLAGLSVKFGSNRIDQADITLSAKARLDDFANAQLDEYSLQISRRQQKVLTASGSGKYDLKTQGAAAQTTVDLSLPALLDTIAVPGANLSSGALKLTAQIGQKQNSANGTALDQTISGNLQLSNVTGQYAANSFDNFETTLDWDAVKTGERVELRKLAGRLRQGGQAGGAFDASGHFDLVTQTGEASVALTNVNQNALRPFVASVLGDKTLASVSITAATSARFAAKGESGVRGTIQIANLVLSDPKNQMPNAPLTADFKLDGLLLDGQAEIKEFAGSLRSTDQPGGVFNVNGKYDLKNQAGRFALKLTDLNQNALRPFLGPALGEMSLASVSVYADTTAAYDANGESGLKGAIVITNLLVTDPASKLPRTPLSLRLQLDGGFGRQILNLRQFQLNLSPTDRAKNELDLSGRIDLNRPNAIGGEIKFRAESLDLTPYYDAFAAPPGPNASPATAAENKSKPPSRPAEASSKPATEPAPVHLPFQNFNVALSVDQLYLRELSIKNWLAKVKLDGGAINWKPFDLELNGALFKTSANINLGVPGYQYDVTLSADRIPVEPIVNTFQPEKRGELKGDLSCQAQVKGAGVTGVNLRKNLVGQIDFNFTNASLKIASLRTKAFFAPIALLLGLPDLAGSPLNSANATARMGNGKIHLSQFNATSDGFLADTAGEITIADDLMSSTIDKWPMHLSVPRGTAERLRMVPKDAPSDSAFVKLPDFVKIAGTLDEPKAEIDKRSLSGAALRKLADQVPSGKSPVKLFPK